MRKRYNEDLSNVKDMAAYIMDLVGLSYENLDLFLNDGKKESLQTIREIHEDITREARQMERLSFELMALQQPIARDLRLLQMSIKLSSTYKRIASHFDQVCLILLNYDLSKREKEILKDFIKSEEKMAKNAISAFLNKDKALGQETIEADYLNNELFKIAIEYIACENKANKIEAVELSEKVLLYKYFERLGDRLARVADLSKRL